MPRPNSTYFQSFIGLTAEETRCKIDQRIEQLEREVHELQRETRALKTNRNDLAPIEKLPAEILTKIFKHATPLDPIWEDLILATHVCRTWRAAALACPSLWSHILLYKEAIARELLIRSKAHPIRVQLKGFPAWLSYTETGSYFLSSLLQIARVRELHIESKHDWEIETISRRISGQCFTEMRSLYYASDVGSNSQAGARLFTKIFSIPMPNLCSLEVCCTDVLHTMKPSLKSLTSLTLKDIQPPSRRGFYTFLSQMACLQTLKIVHTLPVPGEYKEQGLPEVFFPRLSSCTLCGPLAAIADFLSRISYPKDTCTIRLIDDESALESTSTFTTLLNSCGLLQGTFPASSHSVLAFNDGLHHLELRLGNDPESILRTEKKRTDIDDQPSGSIYIILPPSRRVFQHQRRLTNCRFIEQIQVIGLKTASFSEEVIQGIADQEWHSFFLRHSEITHLVVSYPGYGMISALSTATNHDQLLSLPQLESLSVDIGTMFKTSYLGIDAKQAEQGRWFKLLANCLSIRRDSGLPVKRLLLPIHHTSLIVQSTKDRLKNVVDSVEFAQETISVK